MYLFNSGYELSQTRLIYILSLYQNQLVICLYFCMLSKGSREPPMIPLEVKSLGQWASLSLMTSGQRRLRAPEPGLRTILTRWKFKRYFIKKAHRTECVRKWGYSPSKKIFNLWECVLTLVGVQFSKWLGLCSPLKDRALCCTMDKLFKNYHSAISTYRIVNKELSTS